MSDEVNRIWIEVPTVDGAYSVSLTPRGVRAVHWPGDSHDPPANALPGWAKPLASRVHKQLKAFVAGEQKSFDLLLDLTGHTAFRRDVWAALQAIPYGSVKRYGEIAREVGRPGGARAVGQACGANPIPVIIPCHRVIATQNRLGGFSGGLNRKLRLHALEGITCRE